MPADSTSSFSAAFRKPTGLHPTLEILLQSKSLKPPSESCALHAYLTLPSSIFVDRYQLSDPLFLASQNLASLRSLSGETDLEAPDWVIKRWGSASLFELARPDVKSPKTSGHWNISIPMHLRYLPPTDSKSTTTGIRETQIPYPAVFWACEAEDGLKMNVNPFDRVNLGYDGLFGPKTMFYHIPPSESVLGSLVAPINVPVLDTAKAGYVEVGTAVAVLLGFAWVCWKLVSANRGEQAESSTSRQTRKEKGK